MVRYAFLAVLMAFSLFCNAQINLQQGKWKAALHRADGNEIPFELGIQKQGNTTVCYVVNGTERLKTEMTLISKDSVLIKMPVFESSFRVKIINKDSLNGVWIKGGSVKDLVMPFSATSNASRFPKGPAGNVSVKGKWKIEFTRADQSERLAIGEFTQNGQKVGGSVLTPSGDYRYLDGIVIGDSLMISTFDGIHALVFSAKIKGDSIKGSLYSGATSFEKWTAVKDSNVKLEAPVTALKEGESGRLDFSFKDLEGNVVSINDKRFKDKVVVIQLMGSWCPNCMDEMAFLSDYYRKNKSRGVEIIALAYELSTDEARSRKSLQKFRQQFKVEYPMLITGVTAGDPQKTEKTLPQLTAIKVFPTSIILDKKGLVNHINTSFYGPGTGEYYVQYKKEFEEVMNSLLSK
nr:TlpA disulfide reductase family protein [Pedobacter panaciterrae]